MDENSRPFFLKSKPVVQAQALITKKYTVKVIDKIKSSVVY
jgi:hypothetical protein